MTISEAIKIVKSVDVSALDATTKDAVMSTLDVFELTSDPDELQAAGFDTDLLKLAAKLVKDFPKESPKPSKPKVKPLTKPKNSKLVTAKNTAKPTKKGMKAVVKAKPKTKAKTEVAQVQPLAVGDYIMRDNGEKYYGKITQVEKRRVTAKFSNGVTQVLRFDEFEPITAAEYNAHVKPKNPKFVTAKSTAKPSKKGMKVVRTKAQEKEVEKGEKKVMLKVTVKPKPAPQVKTTAVKPEPKAQTTTHIETPEHKQIKRFLAVRKKETLQLAMTAYKSLEKDVTERKIRASSPQSAIIKAIQKSYYKYLTKHTASLMLDDTMLKAATDFVGSQKPSETVDMVKRFIRFTGVSPTEKQLKDYLKDAEKVMKTVKASDPYADELESIIKTVKAAKVGDTIIADTVGLSGLNSNIIKLRK